MRLSFVYASLFACLAAAAQEPSGKPAFEVASVKAAAPSPMNQIRAMRSSDPGRVRYSNFSLQDYVRMAYRVKDFQVQGPSWMESTRFDIEGKLPEGTTENQAPEMLQTLLADRFHLTLHRETKDHAIYALVAAKSGPRLKPAEAATGEGAAPGRGGMPRGGMTVQVDDAGAHLKAAAATLSSLAEMLSRFSERPVVDMSGIQGQYDFDLVLAPESLRGGRGAGGGPGPQAETGSPISDAPTGGPGTIYDAVERYGLKLEPRKAAMEVLIVDRIEKTPTEN